MMSVLFFTLLIGSCGFAIVRGGWEGRVTVAIFLASFAFTVYFNPGRNNWVHTNLGVMAVDSICMLALAVVAATSKRNWPIWVLGFQIAAVATHGATLTTPTVAARAYYAFSSFWSIAEMAVMVAGIAFDRRHDRIRGKASLT